MFKLIQYPYHCLHFLLPEKCSTKHLAHLEVSGVTWTKLKVGPGYMASAVARAYNGGLGAVPPAGLQGAEPLVGGQGGKAP